MIGNLEIEPARHRVAVTTIFFVNGFVLASWVPHIPAIKAYHGIGDGELGLVLVAMPLGSLLALSAAGVLIGKFGSRAMTAMAAIALCLVLPLPILAPTLVFLAAALAVLGACGGFLDVSMNSQAISVEAAYGRPIMSSFHASYSLGGLTGAAATAVALKLGIGPKPHVITTALMTVALAALSIGSLAPSAAPTRDVDQRKSNRARALIVLGTLAFLGLLAEGSMADWSAVYLHDVLSSDDAVAAAGFAIFSMMMAIGRLTGDSIVARLGHASSLRLSGLLAALGLGVALLIDNPLVAIVGIGIMGFGIANVIPIIFDAAGTKGGGPTGTAIATVASIGYFGLLAGPPLIGLTAELVGLRIALAYVCAACIVIGVFARKVA